MKINRLLHVGLTVLTLFFLAWNSYAQEVRLTLSLEQEPLRKVIDEIESQTQYLFATDEKIDVNRKVSVKVSSQPLSVALDQIIRGDGLAMEN